MSPVHQENIYETHIHTYIQARERMQLACLKLQVEATDNWSLYFLQTLEGKFPPSEVNSGGLILTILISTSVINDKGSQ